MNLLVSVKKGESQNSNSTSCEGERLDRCERRDSDYHIEERSWLLVLHSDPRWPLGW